MQALCDVLNIEFYIRPRRRAGAIDERRLDEEVENTERTLVANSKASEARPRGCRHHAAFPRAGDYTRPSEHWY